MGAAFWLLLLVGAGAALAYLLTPYPQLRDWYLSLTPNLYRATAWPQEFFTPATKTQGDWLAATLIMCTALAGWTRWRTRARPTDLSCWSLDLGRADAPWLLALLGLGAALWSWGYVAVPPTYDEVFSAVYCAGSGSVLVAGSYYMLPNNHLLFNTLNGLVGKLVAMPALLGTGRVLSGLAYLGTLAVVYRLGAGWTGRRWAGATLAALAAGQYALWGFGFQARGYALYALLHWVALAALLTYWRTADERAPLKYNALAVAFGYAAVPTFLFYHVAQCLAAAGVQLWRRRLDGRFWRWQAGAGALAGVLYLPALGFSGLGAFTDNDYVRPGAGGLGAFVAEAWPQVQGYATYCFGYPEWGPWPAGLLALLPLSLLAFPRPALRRVGLVYGCWLLVLAAALLGLQRVVFHRNLLALFSLALVLAPLTLGLWLGRWRRGVGVGAALGLGAGLALGFVRHNPVQEPSALYFYDVPGAYAAAQRRVASLPGWNTVAFSEDSFYPYFLLRQQGRVAPHPAHRPPSLADFYVSANADSLSNGLSTSYLVVDTVGDYYLWRRRVVRP